MKIFPIFFQLGIFMHWLGKIDIFGIGNGALFQPQIKANKNTGYGDPNEVNRVKNYLSLVMRKPIFGVCDQVSLKPACSAIGTS